MRVLTEKNAAPKKERNDKPKRFLTLLHLKTRLQNLFLISIMMTFLPAPSHPSLSASPANQVQQIADEFTEEEKSKQIAELFEFGDKLVDSKKYDFAIAAYEQIFMLDPENRKASAKLDLVRKMMSEEYKHESGIVKQVYDAEAEERIRNYWVQVRDYLQQEKFGQARFALEKILLLDPENKEAQKLHDELSQGRPIGKG